MIKNAQDSEKRGTGIDILGKIQWGTHFCLFYENKEDLLDVLMPYFREGLENNEYCIWVTSKPLNKNEAEREARKCIPNFDQYLKKGQIEIVSYSEWYIKDRIFDIKRVLNDWIKKLDYALNNGYTGLRVTGNTAWLEKNDWDSFTEYEEQVNGVITNYQVKTVCSYSLGKCGPYEILDVLHNHQYALVRKKGNWEIYKSMEQVRVERELEESKQRYKDLYNNAQVAMYSITLEGKPLAVNDLGLSLSGYSSKEDFFSNFNSYNHWVDPDERLRITEELKQMGEIHNFQAQLQTKDGKKFWSEFSAKLYPEKGQIDATLINITERKEIERTLKEKEMTYKKLSENLPGLVYRVLAKENNKMIFFNDLLEFMTGFNLQEISHGEVCSIDPLIHSDDREKVISEVKNAIKENIPFNIEYRLNHKNGDMRWFNEVGSPIYNNDSELFSIDGVIFDITEQKRAEQKLKKSEDMYRNLVSNIMDIIVEIDLNGYFLYTSPQVYNILGYKPGEVIGEQVFNFIHPQDLHKVKLKLVEAIKSKDHIYLEFRSLHKRDYYIDVSAHGRVVCEDEVDKVILVIRDISARKLAVKSARESQQLLENTFHALNDAVFVLNTENPPIILKCNLTAEKIFGYSIKEMLGKSTSFLHIDNKSLKKFQEVLYPIIKRGEEFTNFKYKMKRKDGSIFPSEHSVISLKNENGERIGWVSVVRDLTKQMEAEQKLIESEERYRNFVQNFHGIAFQGYRDFSIGFFHGAVEEITGYLPQDFILERIGWDHIIHPEDIQEVNEKIKLFHACNRQTESREYRIVRKDGGIRWVLESIKKIYDPIKEIEGIQGLIVNITEQKKAEQELKRSEEKFRKVFQLGAVGMAIATPDLKFIDVNEKFCEIFGHSKEELLCMTWAELTHPEDLMNNIEKMSDILEGKTDKALICKRYVRKDGKFVHAKLFVTCLRDSKGNPEYMVGLVEDITEKKVAEQMLRESEEKFRTIAEQSLIGILIIQDNQTKYVNQQWADISGYSVEEIQHWNLEEHLNFVHPDNREFAKNQLIKKQKGDPDVFNRHQTRCIKKTGEIIWVEVFAKTITFNGEYADFIMTIDITESIEMEKKLEEQNIELMEINRLKSEFLRRASHELKTPLISIKGFANLLIDLHSENFDSETLSLLEEINYGCQRLQSIISDLIKTSRVDSNNLDLRKSREDLSFLIKFCVNELHGLIESRKHALKLNIKNKLITKFDKEQMYEVITNLLTNAIKYTPPNGEIEVNTGVYNDKIVVSVRDNGIGFTEREKARLFQQFGKIERYGQGFDVGIDGSGLGLYISKNIVELHGGKIWVESEGRNRGSTFYFTLPTLKS